MGKWHSHRRSKDQTGTRRFSRNHCRTAFRTTKRTSALRKAYASHPLRLSRRCPLDCHLLISLVLKSQGARTACGRSQLIAFELFKLRPQNPRSNTYPKVSRGLASRLMGAKSPARKRGHAAAAIIAALSVESAGVGKATGRPRSTASAVNRTRNSRFAATPPVTSTEAAPTAPGGKCLAQQIANHRMLKTGYQIQRLLVAERSGVFPCGFGIAISAFCLTSQLALIPCTST